LFELKHSVEKIIAMRHSKNTHGTQIVPLQFLLRCEYNRDSFSSTYINVALKDGKELNPVILLFERKMDLTFRF
jgi:hypothetical protein